MASYTLPFIRRILCSTIVNIALCQRRNRKTVEEKLLILSFRVSYFQTLSPSVQSDKAKYALVIFWKVSIRVFCEFSILAFQNLFSQNDKMTFLSTLCCTSLKTIDSDIKRQLITKLL